MKDQIGENTQMKAGAVQDDGGATFRYRRKTYMHWLSFRTDRIIGGGNESNLEYC